MNPESAKERYPTAWSWLDQQIRSILGAVVNGYNVRIAKIGDSWAEGIYAQAQENGCCGFVDVIRCQRTTGDRYMLGCNHGH